MYGAWSFLVLANVLLGAGIAIFAKAFFPYKPFLPGLAVYDVISHNEPALPPPAQFDKLIFMVVDALRSDFVFSDQSGFKFTQSLISSGNAIPFTAHATAPTVTMPRVKALTTGSIPSFLDMILNIAESDNSSALASQDNWLAQIHASGRKLNMFGDDTWLKLFPGIFSRSDGTTSFFVSDFTEVDNNVTRHIDDELKETDWDAMILHYLGLDHIGHKCGPQCQHMLPKQTEMDGIVQRIFNAIEGNKHLHSTLLVLAGDHGMNDVGNHGGSSAGETSAALVMMSPKFKSISKGLPSPIKEVGEFYYYKKIQQSDLAPTLAGLLRFPIPKNNLGLFIPELLPMWSDTDQRNILIQNAEQLIKIARASYSDFDEKVETNDCLSLAPREDVDNLACLWRQITTLRTGKSDETLVNDLVVRFSKDCQKLLSSAASNYDTDGMIRGILVALASAASLFTGRLLAGTSFRLSFSGLGYTSLVIAYGAMMFASSYVEEEQHYWYWAASAWMAYLFLQEKSHGNSGAKSLSVLALLRVTRRWNQTDIAKDFLSNNPTILWILVFAAYADMVRRLSAHGFKKISPQFGFVFSVATASLSTLFKLTMAAYDANELIPYWLKPVVPYLKRVGLVEQGRSAFLSMFWVFAYNVGFERGLINRSELDPNIVHDVISVFLATQSRLVNIPLFLLFSLQLKSLLKMENLTPFHATFTTLVFQHLSFFALGNSNAISSIDLSNAYNGVSGYDVGVVGILTFVSNWAGPIWWTSASCVLLHSLRQRLEKMEKQQQQYKQEPQSNKSITVLHNIHLSAFYVVYLLLIMGACMALRTHLFIWTVFSPKFLYAMAWTVLQHGVVNMIFGNVLLYASS